VLGWSAGITSFLRGEAHLRIGTRQIGVTQRLIEWNGKWVRLPRQCPVDVTAALTAPLGRRRRALEATTAVYRHLVHLFPLMAPQLDLIFSTAVAAGRDFEQQLTNLFDVEKADQVERPQSRWDAARRIVREAKTTPNSELWELMRGAIPQRVFVPMFGNPNRMGCAYSALLRKRHMAAIDKAENEIVLTQVFNVTGHKHEAATRLLKLQQMIGSRA
jgi:hypothetical protein